MNQLLSQQIKQMFLNRFGVQLELYSALQFEEGSVRRDIILLPEQEINYSLALSSYIYPFRLASGQRYLATFKGEHEQIEKEKASLKLLLDITLEKHSNDLEAIETTGAANIAGTISTQEMSNEVQPGPSAHVALVGEDFENFKFALAAHEKLARWAFFKIESEQDLEFVEGLNVSSPGATLFITNSILTDERLKSRVFAALNPILQQGPAHLGIWVFLSTPETDVLDGYSLQNVFIHHRPVPAPARLTVVTSARPSKKGENIKSNTLAKTNKPVFH